MSRPENLDEETFSVVVVTPAEGSVESVDDASGVGSGEPRAAKPESGRDGNADEMKKKKGESADEDVAEGGDKENADDVSGEEKVIVGMVVDTKNLYQVGSELFQLPSQIATPVA